MRVSFTFLTMLFCITLLQAQVVIDFEEFDLPTASFLNGSDGSGGFNSGNIFLNNDFNPDFMSWSGWSISNTTDTTTPGFGNQYSAITGSGFDGSANYAVTFVSDNNLVLDGAAAEVPVSGMYITNNTYAFLSMQDGDVFSKKFGGLTGDDPDFFLLTIHGYSEGALTTDSVNFYLADFRDADNTQDFIINEWTWVDLSSLGTVDSLAFGLTSSDNGQFGMNTPAYFCADNITTADLSTNITAVHTPDLFEIYPNPTADYIQITHSENKYMDCYIFDINGRMIINQHLDNDGDKINLNHLPTGTYTVYVGNETVFSSKLVIKN